MDWGKKCLVDFNVGKILLVLFDRSNNIGAIDVKIDGSIRKKKLSFKMLGLTFSSKLDCVSCIISTSKRASKKSGSLIHSMEFLSPEVVLYFYQSATQPCIQCCCYVWASALSCCLELLDKLQKWICKTFDPSLATSVEPLADCLNVASLILFCMNYFGRCSS